MQQRVNERGTDLKCSDANREFNAAKFSASGTGEDIPAQPHPPPHSLVAK
jgi:hypothetical protein